MARLSQLGTQYRLSRHPLGWIYKDHIPVFYQPPPVIAVSCVTASVGSGCRPPILLQPSICIFIPSYLCKVLGVKSLIIKGQKHVSFLAILQHVIVV